MVSFIIPRTLNLHKLCKMVAGVNSCYEITLMHYQGNISPLLSNFMVDYNLWDVII